MLLISLDCIIHILRYDTVELSNDVVMMFDSAQRNIWLVASGVMMPEAVQHHEPNTSKYR